MLVSLNSYSRRYNATFAFSDIPYPHLQQRPLRFACPIWAEVWAYRVLRTCRWKVRCRLFPGGSKTLASGMASPKTDPHAILARA
jgi:hypothetical protein